MGYGILKMGTGPRMGKDPKTPFLKNGNESNSMIGKNVFGDRMEPANGFPSQCVILHLPIWH